MSFGWCGHTPHVARGNLYFSHSLLLDFYFSISRFMYNFLEEPEVIPVTKFLIHQLHSLKKNIFLFFYFFIFLFFYFYFFFI